MNCISNLNNSQNYILNLLFKIDGNELLVLISKGTESVISSDPPCKDVYFFCESGIAIFVWRVIWNYAYSPFNLYEKIYRMNPVYEFNEFEPRLKSAKNRFH